MCISLFLFSSLDYSEAGIVSSEFCIPVFVIVYERRKERREEGRGRKRNEEGREGRREEKTNPSSFVPGAVPPLAT